MRGTIGESFLLFELLVPNFCYVEINGKELFMSPLKFIMVDNGVCKSCLLDSVNFNFLKSLGLRSIILSRRRMKGRENQDYQRSSEDGEAPANLFSILKGIAAGIKLFDIEPLSIRLKLGQRWLRLC
ncbi:hypothetical protein V6N11_065265 [Hibiscus sabdariffa]|uniref:Uncharacterized protein n=1 Tax=Hibiscus sabdariffa TaxID=183260 RepID=A0ABR2QGG2_9ROSI